MLDGRLQVIGWRAVSNRLLEGTGGRLNLRRPDVPCHSLDRVRQPLGERGLVPLERVADLFARGGLLLGKLTKQLLIERLITGNA